MRVLLPRGLSRLFAGIGIGVAGALLVLPAAASAASATASANVNVRSGPGTSFSVLGWVQAGDAVDVSQCKGSFCYITYNGTPGWVSASYLTRGTLASAGDASAAPASIAPPEPVVVAPAPDPGFDAPAPPPADIPSAPRDAFGSGYGNDYPGGRLDRFGFRHGDFGPPRSFDRPDEVCFFADSDFNGDRFCLGQGESRNNLQRGYGPISSIRNPVGLRITACDDFRNCQIFTTSVPDLSAFGEITSITIN